MTAALLEVPAAAAALCTGSWNCGVGRRASPTDPQVMPSPPPHTATRYLLPPVLAADLDQDYRLRGV